MLVRLEKLKQIFWFVWKAKTNILFLLEKLNKYSGASGKKIKINPSRNASSGHNDVKTTHFL
jgi:hypothetical protein